MAEAKNALHYKARRRRVLRMLEDLALLVERTMRVIDQARAPVMTLPFLFEDELRTPQLELLARELARQLEASPA